MALIKCFATQKIFFAVYKLVHKKKIYKHESVLAKPVINYFLMSFCTIAVCLIKSLIGTAGVPITIAPGSTSRIKPD